MIVIKLVFTTTKDGRRVKQSRPECVNGTSKVSELKNSQSKKNKLIVFAKLYLTVWLIVIKVTESFLFTT